ncbi:DUF6985 domain-containing protein [Sphingomonas sp. CJ20]
MTDKLPDLRALLAAPNRVQTAFLTDHPLAAFDGRHSVVVALLRAHPSLNAAPEEGQGYSMMLRFADWSAEFWFRVPIARDYRAIRVVPDPRPVITIEIDSDIGTTRTNVQELHRRLSEFEVRGEAEREAIFASLTDSYAPPAPVQPSAAFETESLGTVSPVDGYADVWFADRIRIAFLPSDPLPVELTDIGPGDAQAIDAAMARFLALGEDDRAAAAPGVLANCHEYLNAIYLSEDDPEQAMLAITDPDAIWRHVVPEGLSVVRDTSAGEPSLYVALQCRCDWEIEHGLQLVWRDGGTLSRISAQDGHVVD